MKLNASSNPLVAIIGCACTATRQGRADKRKTTACRLALDPRYLSESRACRVWTLWRRVLNLAGQTMTASGNLASALGPPRDQATFWSRRVPHKGLGCRQISAQRQLTPPGVSRAEQKAPKRKTTACRLALDPRYSPASRTCTGFIVGTRSREPVCTKNHVLWSIAPIFDQKQGI